MVLKIQGITRIIGINQLVSQMLKLFRFMNIQVDLAVLQSHCRQILKTGPKDPITYYGKKSKTQGTLRGKKKFK